MKINPKDYRPNVGMMIINQNKEIFLSDTKVQPNQLTPKLLEIKKANPKIKVFLKADKMVSYEILMQVMKQIIDSNINNVSLMTNPKD
jgi:biopolymer transport protein ExbD